MAAGAHFLCPKFTFDRISGHFRSKRNFFFFFLAAGGHFGCPKITFDRISGHFRWICSLNFLGNFWQNGCRRPFWMSEIHFLSHFWPFQAISIRNFFLIFDKMADGGHFGNSLSIAILDILDRYRNFFRRPFWMSENIWMFLGWHFMVTNVHF